MRKKWIVLLGIVSVVVILVFLSISKNFGIIPVKEIELKNRVIKRTVSASGEVTASNLVNLSFASTGRLRNVLVKNGDEVYKGQLLATLDNYADYQTAQSYKDARDVAIKDLEYLIQERESSIRTYGGEVEYNIQVSRLKELVSKAEASYQAQLGNVDKTYIYAPFSGTVLEVYPEVGESITAGSTVVKLANMEDMIFKINLGQEDFGFVKQGMSVELKLDSYPNKTYKGEISYIPTFADTSSDFQLEVSILDKNGILVGMTGDAYIVLDQSESELPSVSFDEIYYDLEDKPYLLILKNDVVEKQYIDIKIEGDVFVGFENTLEGPVIAPLDDKFELKVGQKAKLQ